MKSNENDQDSLAIKNILTRKKWSILILSSLLLMGDYFAYDVPFAIHEELKIKFLEKFSPEDFEFYFNLLYTIYVFPNIFLPFFTGILTQKVQYNCNCI